MSIYSPFSHRRMSRSKAGTVSFCLCVFSVQVSRSVVPDSATPWIAALQVSLSITSSRSLLKLMSVESVMPSNRLILRRPVLLSSVFPSIRIFSNESVFPIRWPNYWSFSFSVSPSCEFSGLIAFRMDWFDLFFFFEHLSIITLFFFICSEFCHTLK